MSVNTPTTDAYFDKLNFLQKQIRETVKQDAAGVTVRLATITCRCGCKRGILMMYQCLYCREWFCQSCAETHFGKTVAEYRQENPNASPFKNNT